MEEGEERKSGKRKRVKKEEEWKKERSERGKGVKQKLKEVLKGFCSH